LLAIITTRANLLVAGIHSKGLKLSAAERCDIGRNAPIEGARFSLVEEAPQFVARGEEVDKGHLYQTGRAGDVTSRQHQDLTSPNKASGIAAGLARCFASGSAIL
jgi:hypothetical protein